MQFEKTPRFCVYPDCNVEFWGVGKAKYCDEHKKFKYRKFIYGIPDEETMVFNSDGSRVKKGSLNFYWKHTKLRSEVVAIPCDCCGEEFNIEVIPGHYIYPKYCESHRNEFKRNLYLKSIGR